MMKQYKHLTGMRNSSKIRPEVNMVVILHPEKKIKFNTIPESLPKGFSPITVSKFFAGSLSFSILFSSWPTLMGILDSRWLWSFSTESFDKLGFLPPSSSDEELLSLSLLSWVTLAGSLDFCFSGGRCLPSSLISRLSHEAIIYPRLLTPGWTKT